MGKTKKIRRRNWTFTINNYSDGDITQLHSIALPSIYAYSKEGKNKTPHLQGFFMFENAKTMEAIKKMFPKIHLEPTRGTKQENINYISKESAMITNMPRIEPITDYFTFEPYPWQKNILELIKKKPDHRSIYWYWENKGNVGKSALARHLILKHNALVVGGTERDIKYGIFKWIENKNLTTLIIDIPRSSFSNISYKSIEQVKNGFFFNTKYESTMCVFNIPHVIIFANDEPDYDSMSSDRWKVREI